MGEVEGKGVRSHLCFIGLGKLLPRPWTLGAHVLTLKRVHFEAVVISSDKRIFGVDPRLKMYSSFQLMTTFGCSNEDRFRQVIRRNCCEDSSTFSCRSRRSLCTFPVHTTPLKRRQTTVESSNLFNKMGTLLTG